MPHGKGEVTADQNDLTKSYKGTFKRGLMDGAGRYFEIKQSVWKLYVGRFQQHQKSGKGVEHQANSLYMGHFRNNKYDG